MKNKKMLFSVFLALIVVIFLELLIYSNYSFFSKREKHITFVAYGQSEENWSELKSGAETALKNVKADITFVTSPIEEGAAGEISLIDEQLKGGSDAIVIAPINEAEMDEYLESISSNKKVIVLKNREDGSKNVYPSDQEIGAAIGNAVIDDKLERVLIVGYGNSKSLIRRYESVAKELEESGVDYEYFCAEDNYFDYSRLGAKLESSLIDGIIALDDISLNYVGGEAIAKDISTNIYGVGNNKKDVYLLDYGYIKKLFFIDEFSLGYISAQMATGRSGLKRGTEKVVKFYEVDKENMYDDDLSKVLFPFNN